jgi:hypothetical protein
MEPVHQLVAPQDLGRQSQEFFIEPRGLPVPTTMRLQTSLSQNTGDSCIVDGIDDSSLDHDLLQSATIPPGHVGSAIQGMLVSKRSPATHRTNRAFLCFALSRALPGSHYLPGGHSLRPTPCDLHAGPRDASCRTVQRHAAATGLPAGAQHAIVFKETH